MAKIAVDVALLLPKEINDICVGINGNDGGDAFSNLRKEDNHPHITLAMGVINELDLPEVTDLIDKIVSEFGAMTLSITNINYSITPDNRKSYQFVVGVNDKIIELHSRIMAGLSPYFSYEVDEIMFYVDSDETFNGVSKYWIENYRKKHSNSKDYQPHISLKCSKAEHATFPIEFTTSKLVLCQLGNFCTCRKILFSTNL